MTIIEIIVILAVLMILTAMLLPRNYATRSKVQRVVCMNNLRAIGNVFEVWAGDNSDKFPMELPATNGGTMDFIYSTNAWRHFQVMSNELSTPKVLICPAEWLPSPSPTDDERLPAPNFTTFNNANLSLFVGVDARETNKTMFLSGDRNLTNVSGVKNGLMEVTTTSSANWTSKLHKNMGNILFADGTVRLSSRAELHMAIASTGVATNRLQMPVLTP